MNDIIDYLESKDIQLKPANESNVHTTCWFHGEDPSDRGRLYINIDESSGALGVFNCLAAGTRIITRGGIKEIGSLAGTTAELLVAAPNGVCTWREAPVLSFGEQKLDAITLTRNGVKKTIHATPAHRWFVKSGKDRDRRREVLTSDLKPGMRLVGAQVQSVAHSHPLVSHHGIVRGFIFGDGTLAHGSSVAYFNAPKDDALLRYFPDHPSSTRESSTGKPVLRMGGFPGFYKTELPSLSESRSYLFGWLAGYFAADGCYSSTADSPVLHCCDRAVLEYVRDLCNVLGIVTYGIFEQVRTGYSDGPSSIFGVRLASEDLSEDFFLIEEHRERFNRGAKYNRKGWVVESIQSTDRVEEVFCAVVDGYGNFALEDNILTGNCFVCGETGGFNKIRKHFGDAPIKFANPEAKDDDLPDDVLLGIYNTASRFYYEQLSNAPAAYQYLREKRGLTNETIEKFRLGWAPAEGGLVTHLVNAGHSVEDMIRTGLVDKWGNDFFKDKITIPYLLMGQTIQIRGKDMKGKYLTPHGQSARLFNSDAGIYDDSIVLTEGEFDAMALDQLGFSAMGLPGVSSWQDSWGKHISEAKRVHICFDNDQAGRAGAEKLASKLGPRSRIVEIPDENKGKKIDVSDWIVDYGKNKDDFDWLFRKSVGGLLVSVSEAYERWTEIEGNPNLVGLRWNVREIDSQMRHGMLPGQVVTLIAKTNVGKTLISLNLFHRMSMLKPDIKILFVSLEQTRNEWFERARRIHSFYDPWATNEDTIRYWSDKFFLVDKNKITEDDLEACIEQYEYETGSLPDFVCIDYLGYYARGFTGDEYDRTTSAIMGLKGIAKRKQIVIYAPHQVNRTGSFGKELSADMAKSSGAIEETSDMMLAIWKPDQQPGRPVDEQSGEIHMKILKSRDGATGAEIMYQFAPKTLAIIPNSDSDVSRVMRERVYARNSHSWEQVIYRYRTGDEDQMFPSDEDVRRVLNTPRP